MFLLLEEIKILKEPLTRARDLEGGLRYLPKNKEDSIAVRKKLLSKIGMNQNQIQMELHDEIKFSKGG